MPTALRVLQGNRSKRPLPKYEPKPHRGLPSPPTYLNAYALEEWERLAQNLHAAGVLTVIDQTLFAAYCTAVAHWRQAEEDLERMAQVDPSTHGAVLKTKHGNFVPNPLAGHVNTLRRDVQRLAAEFGLTPSARTQIDATEINEKDEALARKYFG